MVNKVLAYPPHINKIAPLLISITLCILALTILAFILQASPRQVAGDINEYSAQNVSIAPPATNAQLPVLLSTKDRDRYRGIFAAQKNADWKSADRLIGELSDKILLGHILAERYLHNDYKSSTDELSKWLEKYNDHPQAAKIYALALKKNPALRASIPVIGKPRVLDGYGDDNGLAQWRKESPLATDWNDALSAWRSNDYPKAAKLFSAMADKEGLHEWKISASSFWAWRAYKKLGNAAQAKKYLKIASNYPRTFYGILARQKLGQSLEIEKEPRSMSDSDLHTALSDASIRRIVALSQVGAYDLADNEIRQLYYQADDEEKNRLLSIAGELDLASAQISMSRRMAGNDRRLDFARYPIPAWQPYTGFRVERALIYAMARQESGFRSTAVSTAGALGVMQLMPDTASKMQNYVAHRHKYSPFTLANATEPSTNLTLGQGYIEHLLETSLVENNMLYLLTAYNAGPGRLQQWKQKLDFKTDPLLFLESIPYGETRSYVMQVMTNYWIYSDLLGNRTRTQQALLQNKWPAYEGPALPVAIAANQPSAG